MNKIQERLNQDYIQAEGFDELIKTTGLILIGLGIALIVKRAKNKPNKPIIAIDLKKSPELAHYVSRIAHENGRQFLQFAKKE